MKLIISECTLTGFVLSTQTDLPFVVLFVCLFVCFSATPPPSPVSNKVLCEE